MEEGLRKKDEKKNSKKFQMRKDKDKGRVIMEREKKFKYFHSL